MTQQFDATFQGGVLRPADGVELPLGDGDQVRVTIETQGSGPSQRRDVLEAARSVYDGLAAEEVDEVERIALDRSRFFDDLCDTGQ